MDDKDGSVCNEGPWPVLGTIKRELQIMTTTKPPSTKTSTVFLPFGFWSQRRVSCANFFQIDYSMQIIMSLILNIVSYLV